MLEVLLPVRPVRVLHDVLLPAEVGDEVLLLLPGHPKLSLDLWHRNVFRFILKQIEPSTFLFRNKEPGDLNMCQEA